MRFPPGAVMATQSRRCAEVYVIISGKVKVGYRRPEGGEMVFGIFDPKEILGALMLSTPKHVKSQQLPSPTSSRHR
ncbi:cyclic nucleotide-binding domain-containing protein [Mycobacterium intracellulare]|uniref:cyclic nucleotide-binding domain-containing protein n=1 Tax=Mycobacterium intracellulare TaxID=1767 RepID=UPI001CD9A531|nr:cyclic nucleotide-binding domain-containing protein [Mycobacterium intracellulare]